MKNQRRRLGESRRGQLLPPIIWKKIKYDPRLFIFYIWAPLASPPAKNIPELRHR